MYRRTFCPSEIQERAVKKETSKGHQGYTSKRIDPRYKDNNGSTHLHLAIQHNSNDSTRLLEHVLDAGCDVNAQDAALSRPIHIAVAKGYTQCIRKLLEHEAYLDVQNDEGLTPLMIACQKGQLATAKMMIDRGVNVNLTNAKNQMALHFGLSSSPDEYNKDVIRLLLNSGAQVNAADHLGRTPLIIGVTHVIDTSTVQGLLDHGAQANHADNKGDTVLHAAIRAGNVDNVALILQQPVQLDVENKGCETPFVVAIKHRRPHIMEMLIDKGCDTTHVDGLNGTALTLAAISGDPTCMEILLKSGHDPDELGYYGQSPMMVAAGKGDAKIVDILLKYRADPNVTSRHKVTALVKAITSIRTANAAECHKILAFLIRSNVDVNQKVICSPVCSLCVNGKNLPITYAINSGYISLVQMMLIAGSKLLREDIDSWLSLTSNYDMYFELKEILTPVSMWFSQPRDLRFICRSTIRNTMTGYSVEHMKQLPVALPIRDYISYKEFDDIAPYTAERSSQLQNVLKYAPFISPCALFVAEMHSDLTF